MDYKKNLDEVCNTYTNDVKKLFGTIQINTSYVLNHSKNVLKDSLKNTLNSVNDIDDDVETIVTAMEKIFATIDELNNSAATITSSYNDIYDVYNKLNSIQ